MATKNMAEPVKTSGEWSMYISNTTKLPFYFNKKTQKSQWDKPTDWEDKKALSGDSVSKSVTVERSSKKSISVERSTKKSVTVELPKKMGRRSRSRSRSRSVERPKRRRSRSPNDRRRSPDRKQRREEERYPREEAGKRYERNADREGDRAGSDRRDRAPPKQKPLAAIITIDGAEDDTQMDDEERMMRQLMGFGNFVSTKGKKVQEDIGESHVILKRKYRQYMNRRGGFNRPLDAVE